MSRPTLPAPVEVCKFWKNRKHDAVVVSLSTFEGRNIIDVRQHFMTKDGRLQPTTKGLAMQVLRLPEFAAGIAKPLSKAHELGLLDNDGGEA